MKEIKKIAKIIAIISAILLIGSIVLYKYCDKPLRQVAENEYLLPSDTYHLPLVEVPFLTKKAPVKEKYLPIPKKDVKTTIVVKSLVPEKRDITIIIDKKGKVYKSTDTPGDAKIEVTHWKPAFFGLQSKWGIGVTLDIPPDLSIALSWDVIRIWKLHFGVDLGVKLKDQEMTDAWLGTSVKYRILKNNNLFALVGYNWVDKTPYVGICLRF